MNTTQRYRILATLLCLPLVASSAALAHDKDAPLTAAQKSFLSQYESVRAALATDDLTAARRAARDIADNENAAALADAVSIADARDAFKRLSKKAVHLAQEQSGYFVASCPMVEGGDGRWVQTTPKVNNPYFGKSMLTCGSIAATRPDDRPSQHDHH